MNDYRLIIQTPETNAFDRPVTSMMAISHQDRFTVLAGHAPMVTLLPPGTIVIQSDQKTVEGTSGHGVLLVSHTETVVLVHSFTWKES